MRMDDLVKLLKKDKRTGSDYTGTVTRVENGTAYVQLTGSEITDTPVSMTIDCKAGDTVRVRVSGGRAWITGNDTVPPSNEKKEVATKMEKDMANRSKHIIIKDGDIKFKGNTLAVESKNFKLDTEGNAEFSGTVKGANYVDSTSNFSMDLGTTEDSVGHVSPAFTIGGYINGDSSNRYLELSITILPALDSTTPIPTLNIEAVEKDSPDDDAVTGNATVTSLSINSGEILFYGEWDQGTYKIRRKLTWGT